MGSGCGSVGKVVASNSRGPRFEYSLWQNLYLSFTVNCAYWRNKKIVAVVFIAGLAVVAGAPVPQPDPVSEADTFFILPAPPAIIPYRPVFRTGRWSHPTPVVFRGYPHVWKRNADAEVKPVELNNKLIESLFDVLKSGEILELEPSPTSTSMVESEEDEPISKFVGSLFNSDQWFRNIEKSEESLELETSSSTPLVGQKEELNS